MDLPTWMAKAEMSDERLAILAKVSRSTISRLRRKKHNPTPPLASALIALSAGQVTLHELYRMEAPAALPASPIEEAA